MNNIITKTFFTPVSVYFIWSLWVIITLLLFGKDAATISGDGGFTDVATYFLYDSAFFAFAIFARDFYKIGKMKDFCAFVALLAVCLLREMGAQHWLTTTDTTAIKIRFFTNPNNPLSEKIVAGLVIIAVVVIIAYILVKYAIPFVKGFFRLDPISWGVATLGTFGLSAKIVDRMHSKFWSKMGEQVESYASVLEETLEAMIPFSAVLILIQFHFILKTLKDKRYNKI